MKVDPADGRLVRSPVRHRQVGHRQVGGPGHVAVSDQMKNANSVWLNDERWARQRGDGPAGALYRQRQLLAVSEATDSAGASARVVLAFIIGTGSGSGIAIDARVHTGPNAVAGEWALTPALGCGLRNTRTGVLVRQEGLFEAGFRRRSGTFARETGTEPAAEIAAAAADGDPVCVAAMERYEDRQPAAWPRWSTPGPRRDRSGRRDFQHRPAVRDPAGLFPATSSAAIS